MKLLKINNKQSVFYNNNLFCIHLKSFFTNKITTKEQLLQYTKLIKNTESILKSFQKQKKEKKYIIQINISTHKTINYFWNFSSLLGFIIIIQIVTGIFLIKYYKIELFLNFEYLLQSIYFFILMLFMTSYLLYILNNYYFLLVSFLNSMCFLVLAIYYNCPGLLALEIPALLFLLTKYNKFSATLLLNLLGVLLNLLTLLIFNVSIQIFITLFISLWFSQYRKFFFIIHVKILCVVLFAFFILYQNFLIMESVKIIHWCNIFNFDGSLNFTAINFYIFSFFCLIYIGFRFGRFYENKILTEKISNLNFKIDHLLLEKNISHQLFLNSIKKLQAELLVLKNNSDVFFSKSTTALQTIENRLLDIEDKINNSLKLMTQKELIHQLDFNSINANTVDVNQINLYPSLAESDLIDSPKLTSQYTPNIGDEFELNKSLPFDLKTSTNKFYIQMVENVKHTKHTENKFLEIKDYNTKIESKSLNSLENTPKNININKDLNTNINIKNIFNEPVLSSSIFQHHDGYTSEQKQAFIEDTKSKPLFDEDIVNEFI